MINYFNWSIFFMKALNPIQSVVAIVIICISIFVITMCIQQISVLMAGALMKSFLLEVYISFILLFSSALILSCLYVFNKIKRK